MATKNSGLSSLIRSSLMSALHANPTAGVHEYYQGLRDDRLSQNENAIAQQAAARGFVAGDPFEQKLQAELNARTLAPIDSAEQGAMMDANNQRLSMLASLFQSGLMDDGSGNPYQAQATGARAITGSRTGVDDQTAYLRDLLGGGGPGAAPGPNPSPGGGGGGFGASDQGVERSPFRDANGNLGLFHNTASPSGVQTQSTAGPSVQHVQIPMPGQAPAPAATPATTAATTADPRAAAPVANPANPAAAAFQNGMQRNAGGFVTSMAPPRPTLVKQPWQSNTDAYSSTPYGK